MSPTCARSSHLSMLIDNLQLPRSASKPLPMALRLAPRARGCKIAHLMFSGRGRRRSRESAAQRVRAKVLSSR